MKKNRQRKVEVPPTTEGFGTAQEFIEDQFGHFSVNPQVAKETTFVFEAVYNAIISQELPSGTTLAISTENRLDSINLKIGYAGERFSLSKIAQDDLFLERDIMELYADKVSHSYRFGYNIFCISVKKSPKFRVLSCCTAILLAIITYLVLAQFLDAEEQLFLLDNYVFPLEQLLANAVLMVGAPVTFFSLLKNASDTFIVAERNSNTRSLLAKAVITSVAALLLALLASAVVTFVFADWRGYDKAYFGGAVTRSFADIVTSMIPPSIFEPFEAVSPIPLIAVALLVTYALCSAGKDFDVLKTAIDASYGLFSRMLSVIMSVLPFGCFLAFLDVPLAGGHETLVISFALTILAISSVILPLATYAVRLKVKGIKVGQFIRKLLPLLRENYAIGSAIDATPFNIRYCVTHFGMNRKRVSQSLPVLAQVNLDGNAYLLMLVAMLYIFAAGAEITVVDIAVIAAFVLFLSFGSPNQPGSILIGTLIIIAYINSYEMICMAFYLELFLGSLQNLINVTSDIVVVAEEEKDASD